MDSQLLEHGQMFKGVHVDGGQRVATDVQLFHVAAVLQELVGHRLDSVAVQRQPLQLGQAPDGPGDALQHVV